MGPIHPNFYWPTPAHGPKTIRKLREYFQNDILNYITRQKKNIWLADMTNEGSRNLEYMVEKDRRKKMNIS